MVSQRSKIWVDWIFGLRLHRMQSWEKEHIGHMSTIEKIICVLVIKEAK
jgi:hypothetical protein